MLDVHLHGRLKRCLAGRQGPLRLHAHSPAEAVLACETLLEGFRAAFEAGDWRLMLDGQPVADAEIGMRTGRARALHIVPCEAGAGLEVAALVAAVAAVGVAAWAYTQVPDLADYDEAEDPAGRQSYFFRGARNSVAQGGPVPLIYGGPVRVGSTLVSGSIENERVQLTEPAGEDWDGDFYGDEGVRYRGRGGGSAEPRRPVEGRVTLQTRATIRAVDLLGEGPIGGLVDGLKSVYIDGTPVQSADGSINVEGISIEQRLGLPDQSPPEGVPETVTPLPAGTLEVTSASPRTRTIARAADSARVTLRFPRLTTIGDNGDTGPATVSFRIDVQAGGGAYATVVEQTIHDKTNGPAELSFRIPLEGEAPYNVRIARTNPDSDSDRVHDDLEWSGLEAIDEVRQSYPHTALVAVVAEADKYRGQAHKREYEVYGRLVDVPSNYDPDTRAYTGLWDGTFKTAWTDNGAWCVYDILKSRRFGLGQDLPAANLGASKWLFYDIARFCDELVDDGMGGREPRFRFTGVIARRADATRLIAGMLSNFRAAMYYGGGRVVPVGDGPSDPVMLAGPANVADGRFRYAGGPPARSRHSAIAVSFSDPAEGYKQGVELVVDDALVARYGWRRRDVAAMYCASRGQANRHGQHLLIEQEHESDTVRYGAGLDHAHVRPGDVVRAGDPDRAGERTACRVTGSGGNPRNLIYVDALPPSAPNGDVAGWTVHVVHAGGRVATYPVENFTLNRNCARLVLPQGTDALPPVFVAAMCVFTSAGLDSELWRVLGVGEQGPLQFDIRARAYEPGRYAAVERGLNLDTFAPPGAVGDPAPPAAVTLRQSTFDDGLATRSTLLFGVSDPVGGRDPRVTGLDYELRGPAAADRYRPVSFQEGQALEIRDVRAGAYRARARYILETGAVRSAWRESAPLDVTGFDPLAVPAGVGVVAVVGGYRASWTAPPERDYAYTEILDRSGDAAAEVRGRTSATSFNRLGLGAKEHRVSVRHVDRTGRVTSASAEIAVSPLAAAVDPDAIANAVNAAIMANSAFANLADAVMRVRMAASAAEADALAAGTSETNAAGSATAAAGSASTAASEAETAENEASASATSADASAASATAAGNSADAAASSARTASAKATEAGASATAAEVARVAAETAQSAAETSETNAASSETDADGSASAAARSATEAAASATAADNSADDARTARAGIEAAATAAMDAELNTRLAAIVALRVQAGDAASNLELVAISDPTGDASAVRIRADQLVVNDNFSVDATGALTVNAISADVITTGTLAADRITADVRNWRSLWEGSQLVDATSRTFELSAAWREFDQLELSVVLSDEGFAGTINIDTSLIDAGYVGIGSSTGSSRGRVSHFAFTGGPNAGDDMLVRAYAVASQPTHLRLQSTSVAEGVITRIAGLRNPVDSAASGGPGPDPTPDPTPDPPPQPTIENRAESCYRRAASRPSIASGTASSVPPAGWSSSNPGATSSLSVWRARRTARYINGSFSMVGTTAWSVDASAFEAATPVSLPAAVAPSSVAIVAVTSVGEGASQALSVSVVGGTYDVLEYAWSVDGGASNGSISGAGASVTYTAPQVSSTRNVTVRCRVTARGTGVSVRNGTSAAREDTEIFQVTDTPTVLPDAVAPTSVAIAAVTSVAEGVDLAMSVSVAGGTYDALDYAWEVASGPGAVTGNGANVTYNSGDISSDRSVVVRCTVTARGTGSTARSGTSAQRADTEAFLATNAPPPAPVVGFSGASLTQSVDGFDQINLQFQRRGTWNLRSFTSAAAGLSRSGTWVSPQSADVGDGYEIRAQIQSGSVLFGNTSGWQTLTTQRSWSVAVADGSGSTASATVRISIRAAGTTAVLASADYSMSLTNTD